MSLFGNKSTKGDRAMAKTNGVYSERQAGRIPDVLLEDDLKPIHPMNPSIMGGYVQITPQKAERLLELNQGNRRLKPGNRRKLNRALVKGFWDNEAPDPIVINQDGLLDNGQHRLVEIVSTQSTVWANVVVGVSTKVMNAMDRGAVRTMMDRLEIEEARGGPSYKQKDKVVAAVKVCLTYDADQSLQSIATGSNQSDRFSEYEQWEYFKSRDRYFEALAAWGKKINDRADTFKNAAPNRLLVVFKHALLEGGTEEEDIEVFFDELTGRSQPRPQVFVLLKKLEKLTMEMRAGQRHPLNFLLGFYVKGWNAFITDQPLTQLRYSPGGKKNEKFPSLIFGSN